MIKSKHRFETVETNIVLCSSRFVLVQTILLCSKQPDGMGNNAYLSFLFMNFLERSRKFSVLNVKCDDSHQNYYVM